MAVLIQLLAIMILVLVLMMEVVFTYMPVQCDLGSPGPLAPENECLSRFQDANTFFLAVRAICCEERSETAGRQCWEPTTADII